MKTSYKNELFNKAGMYDFIFGCGTVLFIASVQAWDEGDGARVKTDHKALFETVQERICSAQFADII